VVVRAVVERFAAGGYGLCRTSEGVIFVRGAIPGEEIEITRVERRRGVGWARAWRLLTPSPDRIASVCPHFPTCGGCDFHHVTYERELEAKRQVTAETLRRLSGLAIEVEGPIVPHTGAQPLEYRNTIRIQGGATDGRPSSARQDAASQEGGATDGRPSSARQDAASQEGGGGYLGFCEKESNSIVDIRDCPIAAKSIREELPLRKAKALEDIPRSVTFRAGQAGPDDSSPAVSVVTTWNGRTEIEGGATDGRPPPAPQDAAFAAGGPTGVRLLGPGPGFVWIRLLDRLYRVGPRSFFQVNTAVAEEVIRDLRELLPPGRRFVDLFAWVGTFAIALADRYERVEAYEISRSALDDFRVNAEGLAKITIREWDAARGLSGPSTMPALKEPLERDDIVIVDPPRVGLPDRLTADLVRMRPSVVAYVSCDPATLARDLKALVAAGYAVARPVRLYDMFPRTAHVESLAILTRT
jgi:23S rRNA (uracil1939-C5)-methyltransferase